MSLVNLVKSMVGISLPEPFIRTKPSALKEELSACAVTVEAMSSIKD